MTLPHAVYSTSNIPSDSLTHSYDDDDDDDDDYYETNTKYSRRTTR
jgi:hypothetical protein